MTLYELCEKYDCFRTTYDVRYKDAVTIFNDFTAASGLKIPNEMIGDFSDYICESQIVPLSIIANTKTTDELLYPDVVQQLLKRREA